ncbi:MAG: biotin--[acetyl-CoA-carboxylase] ligase [Lachnospiraceae bacterium]|nr:biotin--[acetyl-CoA-carboxylase] ligase [Lachnospiraceae bacterium]
MTTGSRQQEIKKDPDRLTKERIEKLLDEKASSAKLLVFDTVEGSTNDLVKEAAKRGEKEGYTLIAGGQTAGKGRVGRRFFSPRNTGIYMSVLLRPGGFLSGRPEMITTMATAACRAVEEVSGEKALIKWVNDIYVRGKKTAGILTEASFDTDTRKIGYAVLGIGFNVYPPEEGFPEEIQNRAGSVFTERKTADGGRFSPADQRCDLAAAFLNRFFDLYRAEDPTAYVTEYRERSLVVGRTVTVLQQDGKGSDTEKLTGRCAKVLSVDEECRLVVRYEDGRTETLSSGEISIRL